MYFERYEATDAFLSDVWNTGQSLLGSTSPPGVEPSHQAIDVRPEQIKNHGELLSSHTPKGLELASRDHSGREFGTRFHQLADAARRKTLGVQHVTTFEGLGDVQLESECQSTFAAYEAHWLGSPLTFLESERTHTLPLPETKHSLVVKIDAVVRHSDGTIGPFDTKTENKPGYNFREDWAGRTQASLYLWALQKLYPTERVSRLVVDVVTRGGAKRAPVFSRIDDISRTPAELDDAIRNVIWVCEDVEYSRQTGWWRSNMNICKRGWERCEYYDLHVYGRTPENLAKYKPAEVYLDV